jgi:hypothetical protein
MHTFLLCRNKSNRIEDIESVIRALYLCFVLLLLLSFHSVDRVALLYYFVSSRLVSSMPTTKWSDKSSQVIRIESCWHAVNKQTMHLHLFNISFDQKKKN